MKFFKFWVLLFLAVNIHPSNVDADCGSYIYISSGTSNPSSNPDPPVNSQISLPDFVIKKIWLSDSAGIAKTTFTPGEAMQIHVDVKNVGADTPSGINIKYFLSNGKKRDSNPKKISTDFIHKDDLQGGETHSELKNTTAPTTLGTYNMAAKADSDSDITEMRENNNWSDEAVFVVTTPNYTPVGSLELATCNATQGWASDQNTTNPIYIHVYAGDANGNNQVFKTAVYANIYQDNVGYHGFTWSVPDTLKTGAPFTLFFYAINVPAGNNPLIGQTQLICVGSWFNPIMNLILNNN
ncbi:MAG: hypothetical protein US25_C0017G0005 [Candidatus Moranbacteria bacterium GW2011_GWE1_36_7]|nr:MAG: hypothetical protein UR99_C0025G0005 [Candidatus Moranbacteria bacterium GW2011_GWD2_36_12]KKQ06055.1 MAG: hypothetical protein US16_C0026G0005 [Candidatus Moranbacteria bacterium GW2011_GWE2_36_40]KKQ14907.1 MAG: hypothetical protein US25_C0017G0005 [Candidatus Moranbacteria bacterium GW2011_GWE1_36_7]